MMRRFFYMICLFSLALNACNNKQTQGGFTLEGTIKNIPDQEVYLEQLFFSDQPPQVLDTANIKNGKFEVEALASETGMYRLRFEKENSGYIFINDKPDIELQADLNDQSLRSADFKTPANRSFVALLTHVDAQRNQMVATGRTIDSLKASAASDSLLAVQTKKIADINKGLHDYILKYIDTTTQPVIALFALGFTQGSDPAELKAVIPKLNERFPGHQGIAGVVAQYNDMMAEQEKAKLAPQAAAVGAVAPDFTMNDTDGKPFSLKQLRGKYVLVDFWASWCGPCRAENPNVVEAYNKYKDKNFTVLGVSLDEDKQKWLQAIKNDGLTWKHVSDLKGWQNATVNLYGYDGIPYNVLLDPNGKILAKSLREGELQTKLAQLLN